MSFGKMVVLNNKRTLSMLTVYKTGCHVILSMQSSVLKMHHFTIIVHILSVLILFIYLILPFLINLSNSGNDRSPLTSYY